MPFDPAAFDLPPLATPDDVAAAEERINATIALRTSDQAARDAAQQASLDFLKAQLDALPDDEAPAPTSAREPVAGVVSLDSFAGSTDDDKLTNAMSYCAAQTERPKIGYSRRQLRLTVARVPYPGFAFGPMYPRPTEQARAGNPYDVKIAVPANTANPFGSWLRYPAGETHKNDISGEYEGSGLKSSLMDTDSGGVLWTSVVHDLGATNFQHIMGNDTKKMLITMTTLFDGHCNINNALGCSVHVGGSDSELFPGARSNIDGKPAAGAAAVNKFHVWLDNLQKSDVFNPYVTAEGAWGALRVSGSFDYGSELDIIGFLGEGRNAGQPSTGPLIVHEGGEAYYHRVKTNYGTGAQMFLVKGGRAIVDRLGYKRADGVDETRPMIERTGGELEVRGARRSGTWTGRPLVKGAADCDASVTRAA